MNRGGAGNRPSKRSSNPGRFKEREASALRTFESWVALEDDDQLDLARAALALAEALDPSVDVEACVARLDALAEGARALVPPGARPAQVVEALNRHLFQEQGFRGNLEQYYDPQNSLLHRVLDRKVGIPITLSLVYLEVGQRLGLPMVGVGLPGHFVVKVADAEEELLLDPFYGGQRLDRATCQKRLDAIYGGKVVLSEQFLRAVGKREILARMLYNLKRVYTKAGDRVHTLRVLDLLLALQPYAFEERRDRGLLRYQQGQYEAALQDLRAYLSFLPSPPDAGTVLRAIAACERLRAPHS